MSDPGDTTPAPPPSSAAGRLVSGFASPMRGLGFVLKHPTMLRYIVVPLLINLVIFSVLFFTLGFWLWNFTEGFTPAMGIKRVLLVYPLKVLAAMVVFVVCALAVTILGNLVALPFNSRLCVRVIEAATGSAPADPGLAASLKDLPREVLDQLKKWGLWLVCVALALMLHLVPLVGWLLGIPLSLLVSAWFFGLEYLEYPMSALGHRFASRLGYAWRHAASSLGLGCWVFLTFPIVGFLTMPLCVAGATLLYLDDPARSGEGPGG